MAVTFQLMANWRRSFLGIGAFAVVPVAVLSSQGLTVLLMLIALGQVAAIRGRGLWRRAGGPLASVFAVAVAWAVLSSGWAVTPKDAMWLSGSLAVLFFVIVMVLNGARQATAAERTIIGAMVVAGFALGGAILAAELLLDLPLANLVRGARVGEDGVKPTLLNPALTVLVLMVWPVAAVLWARRRWLVIPAATAVLLLLSLGESVTAWIALAAGVTAFGVVAWTGRLGATGLGIAAAAAVLAAPLIPQVMTPERMAATLEDVQISAIHRIYIWEFTAARIAEKPLMGWGLDSSRNIPGGDAVVVGRGTAISLHPHNAGLQVWLELGLPGALAFAALLVITGRGVGRLPIRARAGAAATFAAAFVFASLSYGIWQNWWIAALGLTAAVSWAVFGEPPPDSVS